MKTEKDNCEHFFLDERAVAHVRAALPSENVTERGADLFRTMADPTRLRILQALSLKELCVCDLANLIGLSQSATSHQLRTLRQSGAVRYRKEGKSAYYRLDDDHVRELLAIVSAHIAHKE